MAEVPRYRQIADALRAKVQAGGFRTKEDPFPGEAKLMETEKISQGTARNVLRLLRDQGVIDIKKGARPVVRSRWRVLRNANARLAATQWGAGKSMWDADLVEQKLTVDSIRVYESDAPEHVAAALGVTRVLVRDRRYLLPELGPDGKPAKKPTFRPVLLATSYLDLALVADTRIADDNPGDGGIYARLADLGYAPTTFTEQLMIDRLVDEEQVARLDMAHGATPIALQRVAQTADGRVVEVNDMLADPDAFVFQWTISA